MTAVGRFCETPRRHTVPSYNKTFSEKTDVPKASATTIGKPLIPARVIQRRVRELGVEIARHYRKQPPILLGLMNGAVFFLVDLLRELPPTYEVRCATVQSYTGKSSTGKIKGLGDIQGDFTDREVLLVDDVLDTGLTLATVRERLLSLGAKRVEICVFLRKNKKHCRSVPARWVGFEIEDEFVIGYGLDYNGLYRGLKSVRIML